MMKWNPRLRHGLFGLLVLLTILGLAWSLGLLFLCGIVMHDAIRIANPNLPIDEVIKQSDVLIGYVDQVTAPLLGLLLLWIVAFVIQAFAWKKTRREAEQSHPADTDKPGH